MRAKYRTMAVIGIAMAATGYSQTVPVAVIKAGTAQAAVSTDVVQLSNTTVASPPYVNLNASQQALSVNVGGCISTDYPGGAPGEYSTTAVVGCIVTPPGTYTGGLKSWPDAALTGVAISQSVGPEKASTPLMTMGGTDRAGTYIYGANINTINCRAYACMHGGGFDFELDYGLETDVNIFSKTGGAPPAGEVNGNIVQLYGDTQNASNHALNAFNVVGDPTTHIKWRNAYTTNAGAADVALFANSQGDPTSSSASQSITFISRGAGGADNNATIQEDASGTLQITAEGGAVTNGPQTTIANSPGLLPASCALGQTVTSNYITGSAEVDHFNCSNTGGGFAFYQKTGASSATQLARLSEVGGLSATTIAGGVGAGPSFATNASAGSGAIISCSGGHICDNVSGMLSLTTGSLPSAGIVATITFGITRTNYPNCVFNINAPTPVDTPGALASSVRIEVFSALAASSTYALNYVCLGS